MSEQLKPVSEPDGIVDSELSPQSPSASELSKPVITGRRKFMAGILAIAGGLSLTALLGRRAEVVKAEVPPQELIFTDSQGDSRLNRVDNFTRSPNDSNRVNGTVKDFENNVLVRNIQVPESLYQQELTNDPNTALIFGGMLANVPKGKRYDLVYAGRNNYRASLLESDLDNPSNNRRIDFTGDWPQGYLLDFPSSVTTVSDQDGEYTQFIFNSQWMENPAEAGTYRVSRQANGSSNSLAVKIASEPTTTPTRTPTPSQTPTSTPTRTPEPTETPTPTPTVSRRALFSAFLPSVERH